VNADFTLGTPGTAQTQPLAVVTFHAHAADVAASKAALAQAVEAGKVPPPGKETDPLSFPDAELAKGMVAFSPKSKTGGGYSFTLAKAAGEGTLLQDKSGQVWKVKQVGNLPILTDGEKHYMIHGDLNLKVVNEHPFDDQSPPLHGHSVQDTKAEVAQALEAELPDDHPVSLESLGLETGHTFTTKQKSGKYAGTWQVIQSAGGWSTAINVQTGKTQSFGPTQLVTGYNKATFAGYKVGDDVVPSKLKLGDHVKAGGKTFVVTHHGPDTVAGEPGATITFQDVKTGSEYGPSWNPDSTHLANPAWKLAAAPKPKPEETFEPAAYEVTFDLKSSADLKPGDVFATPGTQTPYKVVEDLGHVVKVIDGKGGYAQWSKEAGNVLGMAPAGSGKAIPDAHDMPKFDGVLADAPVGALVSGGYPGNAVWQIVAKDEHGGVAKVKLVKASAEDPYAAIGSEASFALTNPANAMLRPEGVSSTAAPATESFKKGDVYKGSGVSYEVTSVKGGKVYGKQKFPNGKYGTVTPLNIPAGAKPEPAEPVEPAKVADGFSWEANDTNDGIAAGVLPIGTHVQGYGGTVFQITGSTDPSKVGLTVVGDPHPGDSFHGAPMPAVGGFITASTEWVPSKVEAGVTYPSPNGEHYQEAGKTTVEALEPGEFFKSVTGPVYQVVSHSATQTLVKNVTTGEVLPTHPTTAATKVVPNGVDIENPAPGLPEQWGLEKATDGLTVGQLEYGDYFSGGDGAVYTYIGDGTAEIHDHPSQGLQGTVAHFVNDWPVSHYLSSYDFYDLHNEDEEPSDFGDGVKEPVVRYKAGGEPQNVWALGAGEKFEYDGHTYTVLTPADGDEFEYDDYGPELEDDMGHVTYAMDFDITAETTAKVIDQEQTMPLFGEGSSEPATAVPPLSPNTQGQPVGALSIGDHFQTDGGSVFQVTGKNPSGIVNVKSVHLEPGDGVGDAHTFGPTLVPAAMHVGALPGPSGAQAGDSASPSSVLIGDHVIGYGSVYKVTGKTSKADGSIDVEMTKRVGRRGAGEDGRQLPGRGEGRAVLDARRPGRLPRRGDDVGAGRPRLGGAAGAGAARGVLAEVADGRRLLLRGRRAAPGGHEVHGQDGRGVREGRERGRAARLQGPRRHALREFGAPRR
jgi:hypothetical protein